MKIRTQNNVGGVVYSMEFEGKDDKDSLLDAIVLSNPPKYCQCCNNTELFKMDANKDKDGNIYINIQCMNTNCFAKAKLGSYRAGGYFWHKFEKYVKADGQTQKQEQKGQLPMKHLSLKMKQKDKLK